MIKRAFVLFFCLAHLLVSPVLAERQDAVCKLEVGTSSFSIYPNAASQEKDDFIIEDDTVHRNLTIVRADDFEWKENFADLLRHRHSTYRFLTIVAHQESPDYKLPQIRRIVRESVSLPSQTRRTFVLPGYYGFLHRLCPF